MTREQFISHVENCQSAFRRFLTALCCGDSQLADDIAQESLIKAYLSCDGLNSPDKFNSWLYRIGFNTFINHRRAIRPSADITETAAIEASDKADGSFAYQDLHQALSQLPERERTSIVLYYMEGYSIKEVSAIVEASEAAVKQHLSRGRTHLRTLLSPSASK